MAEEPSACGVGICSRAMARMRNQNSGPQTAKIPKQSATAARLDARSSEIAVPTSAMPSSISKPSTAQYFTRHIPTAAVASTAQKISAPLVLGSCPRTSQPARKRTRLATPISAATTRRP